MKKIVVFSCILFSIFTFSQVKWMTIHEALKAQKENPKKMVINFVADWCVPCKEMEKTTYQHPTIAEYLNNNYYAVKFNAEGNDKLTIFDREFANPDYKLGRKRNFLHEFTKYMNINAIPSLVILDENTNPITILQGALSAKELEPYLPFFSNNDYLKIKTREEWESYQKKFKSKIKE